MPQKVVQGHLGLVRPASEWSALTSLDVVNDDVLYRDEYFHKWLSCTLSDHAFMSQSIQLRFPFGQQPLKHLSGMFPQTRWRLM